MYLESPWEVADDPSLSHFNEVNADQLVDTENYSCPAENC